MRTPRVNGRRLLETAGYVAFGVAALLVSLYLTFPAEALGQRLAHEVRSRTQGRLALSFGEVSPYRLSGIAARDVRVRAAQEGQTALDLRLDGFQVRLRLLPLVVLRLSAEGGIELGDGTIDASVTPTGEDGFDADVEIDDLDLGSPPVVPRLVGLPLGGEIDGEATTAWRRDVRAATGRARLTVTGASLGPGAVSGFTLPLTELGTLSPDLVIENGKLRVASFRQEGGQVQLKLSGVVHLRPEFQDSQLDLCVQIKPDAGYLRKNPNVETALQLAEVRFRRDPQGFLNIPLGGTVKAPRPRTGLCPNAPRE